MGKKLFLLFCTVFWLSCSQVSVASWVPELVNDATQSFQPNEKITLLLPQSMPADTLQFLALELNGVDLSQIVEVAPADSGQYISVTPPEPLRSGVNELRLVQYTASGDVIEKGVWNITVGAADNIASEGATRFFNSTILLEGSYRIAEENVDAVYSKHRGQGSMLLQGESSSEQSKSSALFSLIYDNEGAQVGTLLGTELDDQGKPVNSRDLELAEYLVSSSSSRLTAMVGHHQPMENSLLIQDFYRRGASLTAKNNSESLVASGFAYRTEPVSGFRYGLGIGNRDHRVAGSIISFKPIPSNQEKLTITASYIDGAGEDHSGLGLAGNTIQPLGRGHSLAIGSQLLDDKLQFRAELAETNYDLDGAAENFSKEEGEAHSFLGLFHIKNGQNDKGEQEVFSVGVEQKQVDTFFRSLANPSLPFDRDLKRVFASYQVGGMFAQFQLARELDNVANDRTLPILRNDLISLLLNYSPTQTLDEKGEVIRRWYGQPTFSFSTEYADQSHQYLPEDLAAFKTDTQTVNYVGGIASQYESSYWAINHSYGLQKDFSSFPSQNRLELTDLNFQTLIGSNLTLGSQFQYSSTVDRTTNNVFRNWVGGVDLQLATLNQRLLTTLNYNLNQAGAKDDSVNTKTETLGFRLEWALKSASNNRPGWTLWLQGERQEIQDLLAPVNDQSQHQVFIGARLDWPATFQY